MRLLKKSLLKRRRIKTKKKKEARESMKVEKHLVVLKMKKKMKKD
jgi:hypothetical protein